MKCNLNECVLTVQHQGPGKFLPEIREIIALAPPCGYGSRIVTLFSKRGRSPLLHVASEDPLRGSYSDISLSLSVSVYLAI